MRNFGGRGAILLQLLGAGALVAAIDACSDKPSPDVVDTNQTIGSTESEPASTAAGFDRDSIREILPGADVVRELKIVSLPADRRRVQYKALGRTFTLRLERNWQLFAPDLTVVRDGVEMTASEAGVLPPFRGTVEGDDKSWVRVNTRNGLIEGLVFTNGELYEIRPSADDPTSVTMAPSSMADFLEHPAGAAGDVHCGVTAEAPPATSTETTAAPAPQGCTWLGIHMISDYTHAAKVGGTSQAAETEMTTRTNEIDAIYRADLNHGFRLEKLTSHTTQTPSGGDPGYNVPGLTIEQQLDALSAWKSANDASRGLVQVHAGRVSSGAVGLAWVGAVCNSKNGSSVSNYLGTGRSTTVCAAHEIGHNFGANHDASGAAYIMAPSVNANATTFSSASKSSIASAVGKASCFSACGGAGSGGTGGASGSGGTAGTGGTGGKGGAAGTGGAGGATGGTAGKAGSGGTGGATGGTAGTGGTGGTGGATGGTSGTGGTGGTTGGTAGTGGATGGTSGTGGTTGGTAGKAGSGGTGGATGGTGGTGGATGGTGGTGGATGGTGGTGGGGGTRDAGSGTGGSGTGGTRTGGTGGAGPGDPGCGCRVGASSQSPASGGFAGMLLAAAAVLLRRGSRKKSETSR